MKEHLVLDFNNPKLEFKEIDIKYLNLTSIYDNINKFNEFAYRVTAAEIFETIFNSTLFQVSLATEGNTVDDMVYVYNMIATEGMIDNKKYPRIMKKTLVSLMKTKGYVVRRTRKKTSQYVYENKSYFVKVINMDNDTRE